MRLTVISHFYNEEFLLPYWLKYHTMVFDHGILIDYQSTDASLDIIRELAPHWEIRPSRNTEFDPWALDAEVIDIEHEVKGWKTVLNTTEFMVHHDLKKAIREVEDKAPTCLAIMPAGVVMCDRSEEYNQPVDERHLFLQRHSGWFEPVPPHGARHRIIHRAYDGKYRVGRHHTFLTDVIYRDDIYCTWWGWSPYPQVKNRKLQIQTRMSETRRDLGKEHRISSEEMDRQFWEYSSQAKDLTENTMYAKQLELLR